MFARAGVRLSDDGNVQVVTFSCVGDPLTEVKATDGYGKVLWRATPSVNAEGLQLVTSSPGRNDGWSNEGGVSPSDTARRTFLIGTERDGYQSVEAAPAELARELVTVRPASFGRRSQVSVDEFSRVNQTWCDERSR